MKNKLATTLILTIIALSTIGYSYACTNGGIKINCHEPCNCDAKFTKTTVTDNEIEKNVAVTTAQITNQGNTIEITLTNGYPCYKAYVNFTIKNVGDKPVHIDEVYITNYDTTALELTLTNLIACTWINPCKTLDSQLSIHILQEAQQRHTYNFQIKIKLSCQQQYPRTIGFWKHQFTTALCLKKGNQHIPSATLEQYLDQITAQSQIFAFTGTRKQKFQQALNILDPPKRPTMEAKLKQQLLALWLNYAAGWTQGWTINGMTAQQIIQGSENALLNHLTNQYEYWKNLCDQFNNLGGW